MDINKVIAKKELDIIGGTPKVYRYWDEHKEKSMDVLSCVERPYSGVISYASIGLSQYDIGILSSNKTLRLELVGACDKKDELFANILASTTFEIIENKSCKYGEIISNVVTQYINDSEMEHIYLMNPFLWEGFDTIEFDDRKIAWLLIVPISNKEKEYALINGYDALETKFEKVGIDIFNLRRKSIF